MKPGIYTLLMFNITCCLNGWFKYLNCLGRGFCLISTEARSLCMSKGKQPRTRVKVPKLLISKSVNLYNIKIPPNQNHFIE